MNMSGFNIKGVFALCLLLQIYAGVEGALEATPDTLPRTASLAKYSPQTEAVLREDLAAAYQLAAQFGWGGDVIYNHISVRIPGEEGHFLINPFGLLYEEITASSLVKIDVNGNIIDPGSATGQVNRAGFVLHSALHEGRADCHAIMHFHQPSAMAVSTMKCGLLPLSQDACLLGDISYHHFEGIAVSLEEKKTLVKDLGPKNKIMMLHNHGVLTAGETIAEAFMWMYWLDKACQSQIMALSAVGGDKSKLHVLPESMRKKVGQQYIDTFTKAGLGTCEFAALKRQLEACNQFFKK